MYKQCVTCRTSNLGLGHDVHKGKDVMPEYSPVCLSIPVLLYYIWPFYVCTFLYTGKQTPYSPLTLQVPKLDNKSKWLMLHALPPFTCIVPPCIQSCPPISARQLQGYWEFRDSAARFDASSLLEPWNSNMYYVTYPIWDLHLAMLSKAVCRSLCLQILIFSVIALCLFSKLLCSKV